ncbi:tubulin-specific chaperone C-like [Oscarella lobularis]|uniref:tubulin-specific chaperone C-like n=1 Tax=Oscarella lobularis TaxID=121494 RepID=UPI003313DBC3
MADRSEKFRMRLEQRKAEMERKKEERITQNESRGAIELFNKEFATEKQEIERLVEKSLEISKSDLLAHFDALALSMQKLKKHLSDSASFLPEFGIKTAQTQLDALDLVIREKRDVLMPKKKFAFKSRKKEAEKPVENEKTEKEEIQEEAACSVILLGSDDARILKFHNRDGETLTLEADDVSGKEVDLSQLNGCVVKIFGTPMAIRMHHISNSKVFSGPVATSVFLDNCTACSFVLACQQLRIHTTTDSRFFIHVSSRAIIEDCSQVGFAPYNWDYSGIERHFQECGLPSLNSEGNHWDCVDDFNWLSSSERSPNWYIVSQDKKTIKL